MLFPCWLTTGSLYSCDQIRKSAGGNKTESRPWLYISPCCGLWHWGISGLWSEDIWEESVFCINPALTKLTFMQRKQTPWIWLQIYSYIYKTLIILNKFNPPPNSLAGNWQPLAPCLVECHGSDGSGVSFPGTVAWTEPWRPQVTDWVISKKHPQHRCIGWMVIAEPKALEMAVRCRM